MFFRIAIVLFLFLATPAFAQTNLTGQTTFYISPNGFDPGNNCLSFLDPCRTIQYAYDMVQQNFDLKGNRVIFQLSPGTHVTGLQATGPLRGQTGPRNVVIRGNILNPQTVLVRPTGTQPSFTAAFGAQYSLEGVKMDHTNTQADMIQVGQFAVISFGYVEFGHNFNPFNHVTVAFNATLFVHGHYKISGGGQTHLDVANQSSVYYNTNGTAGLINVTIVGSPSFFAGFLYVASNASINSQAIGWNGAGGGPKYVIEGNGVIDIGCTNVNAIPGHLPGIVRTGGQLLTGNSCVAPTVPDLHLSASPVVVHAGETTTLSWQANSITPNPTCWVNASDIGYFTAAPDLDTTIINGIAAYGQKTSAPLYETVTYVLRCLSMSGGQAASGEVVVTVIP